MKFLEPELAGTVVIEQNTSKNDKILAIFTAIIM